MVQERLEDIEDDRIAVYVVWVPIWEGEMEPKALRAAEEIRDVRMRQLWTNDVEIPGAFKASLGWGEGGREHASGPVPWDLHALYPAGTKWASAPPEPIDWVSPVVRDEDLAAKLRSLIPKS